MSLRCRCGSRREEAEAGRRRGHPALPSPRSRRSGCRGTPPPFPPHNLTDPSAPSAALRPSLQTPPGPRSLHPHPRARSPCALPLVCDPRDSLARAGASLPLRGRWCGGLPVGFPGRLRRPGARSASPAVPPQCAMPPGPARPLCSVSAGRRGSVCGPKPGTPPPPPSRARPHRACARRVSGRGRGCSSAGGRGRRLKGDTGERLGLRHFRFAKTVGKNKLPVTSFFNKASSSCQRVTEGVTLCSAAIFLWVPPQNFGFRAEADKKKTFSRVCTFLSD